MEFCQKSCIFTEKCQHLNSGSQKVKYFMQLFVKTEICMNGNLNMSVVHFVFGLNKYNNERTRCNKKYRFIWINALKCCSSNFPNNNSLFTIFWKGKTYFTYKIFNVNQNCWCWWSVCLSLHNESWRVDRMPTFSLGPDIVYRCTKIFCVLKITQQTNSLVV